MTKPSTILMSFTALNLLAAEPEAWRIEADRRIAEHRTGEHTLRLNNEDGSPLAAARVRVRQTRHDFLFGTCVDHGWLGREGEMADKYRAFIADNFTAMVAESAMKWPYTEEVKGTHDFTRADRQVEFAREHRLALRGHTLFWSKEKFKAPWMLELQGDELRAAVDNHLQQIVPRFKGKLIAWDVNNEMLDGRFFADRAGDAIRPRMFQLAHELDPETPLFVNEYSILCEPPRVAKYLGLIRELEKQGAKIGGIGIQEHAAERILDIPPEGDEVERQGKIFLTPEGIWKTLDALAETGKPIHLTEISFRSEDPEKRADALEKFFRSAFAHPNVEVIMLWGFWHRAHWLGPRAALVDAEFNLLPAGERLLWLLHEEWNTRAEGTTDAEGLFRFRGFYGVYEATVTLPDGSEKHFPFRHTRTETNTRR